MTNSTATSVLDDVILSIARSQAMVSGTFDEVVDFATREAAHALQVQRVSVWLLDDSRRRLTCQALYELGRRRHVRGSVLLASRYPKYFQALEDGRALTVTDVRADERTRDFGPDYLDVHGIASMLDATLRLEGRVVGVVCHEHVGEPRVWRAEEVAFCAALADQVATAYLAAARRQAADEQQHLVDELEVVRRHENMGRLAAGVIHDLNNLLFCVLGNAELLMHDGLDDDHQELVEEIRSAATQSAQLLRGILRFGARTVQLGTDAGVILRGLWPLLRRLMGSVSPSLSIVEGEHPVFCDVGLIEQVTTNLALNARDAAGPQGVVEIELQRAAAGDPANPLEVDAVRLAVRDDGPGVSEDARRWIFEPFFTTKPSDKGTGLGLSTVKRLVEGAAGAIEVMSPEVGAEFVVWLPAGKANGEGALVAHDAKASGVTDGGRALVVTHEPVVRRTVATQLRRMGFEVIALGDAAEGARVFAALTEPPQLVVVSHQLGRFDGASVVEAMQAEAPQTRGILLSDGRQGAPALPRTVSLDMPVAKDALRTAIASLVESGD